MAGNRTLKLSILADVDDLKKKLNQSSTEVEGFAGKLQKFSKIAGAAFLAAGVAATAYAGKLAVEGVKAAIEDEAAQLRLATSLENVTGATKAQIKETESYILKTSLATGVTDEKLRPSLDRLVRSTKDVEEAQKLQTLAINIAAGTGKDLQAVSEALAKAHDGNFTALKKLGGGIDENIIKSKDFNAATASLAATFEGQASKQAETFQGRMDRLKVAFDEGKEAVGAQLLPIIEKFVNIIVEQVIPNLGKFAAYFEPIKKAIMDNKETFEAFGKFIVDYIVPVLAFTLSNAFKVVGKVAGTILEIIGDVISGITRAVQIAISAINTVIKAYNAIPILPNIPTINGPSSPSASTGISVPSASLPSGFKQASTPTPTTVNNITVNGAIDPASTARQISTILKTEANTSGTLANFAVSAFDR
jgi:hypothetical protein